MIRLNDDIRLPGGHLRIGVTGHRNIDCNHPGLQSTIIDELQWLRKKSEEKPMAILSALAEGADRLVAQLAIAHLDAVLVAPLPFSRREYVKDFTSGASIHDFDQLLYRAFSWFALATDSEVISAGPKGRRHFYARAGAFIVQNCHALIAIWDGLPVRGFGGTAQVVQWARERKTPSGLKTCTDLLPYQFLCRTVIHIHPVTLSVNRYLSNR